MKIRNCLTFVLYILVCQNIVEVYTRRAEKKLRTQIFKDYDPKVRPVDREADPVNVTLDLELFQIIKLNEKEQSLEISAWLRQAWNDSVLSWNPDEHSGITHLNLKPDDIWIPDTVLFNSVMEDNEVGSHLSNLISGALLEHTGTIRWFASAILKTHCDIKVRYFPFDSQECELKFASWTYTTSNLILRTLRGNGTEMDTADYERNSVWKMENTSAVVIDKKYSCCNEPFATVIFRIKVARRSMFYLLNLVFPISVITLLAILSFLLPAESGERISLAVTLLLANVFIMMIVADTTPATSDEIPLISLYFIISMVDMVILMITVCYVNRLHHKETSDGKMGKWTRRFILNRLAYIVRVRPREEKVQRKALKKAQKKALQINLEEHNYEKEKSELIKNINEEITQNGIHGDTPASTPTTPSRKRTLLSGNKDRKDNHPKDCTENNEIAKLLEGIINEKISTKLDIVVKKIEDMDADDKLKIEWRTVAMTVDRCLLLFFLVNFVLTLIGVFSLSPGYVT